MSIHTGVQVLYVHSFVNNLPFALLDCVGKYVGNRKLYWSGLVLLQHTLVRNQDTAMASWVLHQCHVVYIIIAQGQPQQM